MAGFNERFEQLLEKLELNANQMAEEMGTQNVKIYKMLKGESDPSYKTIMEILDRFPNVSAEFLLRGQLPILHTPGAERSGSNFREDTIKVPLLEPTLSYRGEVDQVPLPIGVDNEGQNAVIIRVTDNAMSPTYIPGIRLLAYPVEEADWKYLNSALVLVHFRNFLLLRRIKQNKLPKKGYLTLHADAEDAGFVHVDRNDLRSIWHVDKIL